MEASAGSGKTFALAKRYVRLLINPGLRPGEIPLRNILAITFTNRAALEMKERILELLKKIAFHRFAGPEEEEDVLSALAVGRDDAREKAYAAIEHLIRNYNFFQVRTIDSFINSLLSGCAFRLNLSAGFRIRSDYTEYLRYSLDQLIERAADDSDVYRLFRNFLVQYLTVENRTSWFPRRDILELMKSLFSDSNVYGGGFKKAPGRTADLFSRQEKIRKLMERLRDGLPEGTDGRFVNSLESLLDSGGDGIDLDRVPAYFRHEDLPVRKGRSVPAAAGKLWREIRRELGALCELESTILFNCYLDIFQPVAAGLGSLSAENDVLFLEELNRQARFLFDAEGITVEELYYRLATRFRHYLIDEFQDTNVLQWRNLLLMVEEALSTGGSLFYVGDRKQAIYRFRGGEVALFDRVRERFADFNVSREVLNRNFRSQKKIVEFNNEIFSAPNLSRFLREREARENHGVAFTEADAGEILALFSGARQDWVKENQDGYVRVEFVDAGGREKTEAVIRERLTTLIGRLRERFSCRDIAVLSRDNDGVELITSWLLAERIAVESEKTLNIRENHLIKEIISLLKFLNSPIDELAFASFILGDIFTRAAGIDREKIHAFLFRARGKSGVYLYRRFQQEFPRAWSGLLEGLFRSAGYVPLFELCVGILRGFDVMKHFPEYQGFFMRLLELVREKEDEYASPGRFLEYFDRAEAEDLYVAVTDADSVRVMTVHKAKGLEFEVVIIPFLKMDVKVGSPGRAYVVEPGTDGSRLRRLKKAYGRFSPRLEELYRQEYRRAFADELNNVYVALTRPKKELYAFVPKRSGRNFNLACLLIPEEKIVRGEPRDYAGGGRAADSPLFRLPVSEYRDWKELLPEEIGEKTDPELRERRRRGEILHYLLSFLGDLGGEDAEERLRAAQEGARRRFPGFGDGREPAAAVKKLVTKKRLKPFFFPEGKTVFTEKEAVDRRGNTLRIDRLLVGEKEAWVIDYKSFREETEAPREQVRRYLEVVRELYPRLAVKGFLVYLEEAGVEEVDG